MRRRGEGSRGAEGDPPSGPRGGCSIDDVVDADVARVTEIGGKADVLIGEEIEAGSQSAPGFLAEERAVALASIRRLQGWYQGRLLLVPILWEQEPLLATAGFQQEIERRAPPSETDVAVFVLWSRLGTPLSAAFALRDGRRPTGTEWEFEEATKASRERRLPHTSSTARTVRRASR